MLKNELEDWLTVTAADLDGAADRICAAWRSAIFSDHPGHSLRRYFNAHAQAITDLSDGLCPASPLQSHLSGLLASLRKSYGLYLRPGQFAPRAWHPANDEQLMLATRRLTERLSTSSLDARSRESIADYIDSISLDDPRSRLTFEAVDYFRTFISTLEDLDLADGELDRALLTIDFNHLGYLSGWRARLQATLAELRPEMRRQFLREERLRLKSQPKHPAQTYHPDWPHLRKMCLSVIKEEDDIFKETAVSTVAKIPLNMSAAQLAAWVRSFHDAGLLEQANLTEVFRILARTCRTKRQEQLSAASLSKEYYSVSQVTAAVNRDLMLKMAARIDRDFFPK